MDNIELGTDAWRDARRLTVGGSEIGALFGVSPWSTRFQLYHRKVGNLPEPDFADNEKVFWGSILEPAVAAGIAQKTGWDIMKWTRWLKSERCPGLSASLDYVVNEAKRGRGSLEIKTVDRLAFKNWENEEPPLIYELQLQAQLAVTGWSWGALGVLVGGNELRIYERVKHAATIAKIEAEVAAFWESVRDGKEPVIDFAADADAIKALHRDLDGETVDLTASNRLPILCGEYKSAHAAEDEAKSRKDAAQAEILTIVDKASVALARGWRIKSSIVPGGPVAYERKPYRRMTITEIKQKDA